MDIDKEFESLWALYPNKQGKVNAKKKYVEARATGTTYDEVLKGIEKYIRYCDSQKSWYRPKMGSTWFNQHCWLDEIDEGETDKETTKDNFGNIIL